MSFSSSGNIFPLKSTYFPEHPFREGLFAFSSYCKWNITCITASKIVALYRVRQRYLTTWQHSCEWNRWRGEFVLARPSSETQSISVAMERWSVEHRAFAVVVVTQRIFRRHFSIHRNGSVTSRSTVLLCARNCRESASAAKRKRPGREP